MENSIDVGGAAPILGVRSLGVTFRSRNGQIDVVNELSYDVWSGRTLAIIGESGSGKTVGARAVMGLLPPGAAVRGSIRFAVRKSRLPLARRARFVEVWILRWSCRMHRGP